MENNIENFICSLISEEGIGSIYERIVLKRFFEKSIIKYQFQSLLEYGCKITKGYDNIIFFEKKTVTVSDQNIEEIKKRWRFPSKPVFSTLNFTKKYDLVWNFALVQQNPDLLLKMKDLSQKYVLVFTPNIYNCGTPFHWGYHFLTRTPCYHAEQGSISLRTLSGLKRFFLKNGLKIVDCGYIDMPPIPDIGFSINELKKFLNKDFIVPEKPKLPIDMIRTKIGKMMFVENSPVLKNILRPVMSHHNFILGEIQS